MKINEGGEKASVTRILLVDDSKVNRLLGQKMLEKLSCEVIVAEDGSEALNVIKNNQVHLILMDLEMPKIGGLQAATEIREKKLSFAPIYALTGSTSPETRLLCRAAKMNGYINKPLTIDKLKNLFEKLF